MNFYIIVEGETEKVVYQSWVPLVNPELECAERISDVNGNNFYLISGRGYPYYFNMIDDAISDINNSGLFDRLVISVDSEDMTCEEKSSEIQGYLRGKQCVSDIRIVIQHFCFECWALGNRRVVRQHPTSQRLRTYKQFFNVRVQDPELLPAYPDEELNRAQFAEQYLRAALNERNRRITYLKGAPKHICYHKYFAQVKRRLDDTGHITSFSSFLDAFV